jgi:CoA:oxalate CoA-transferase
MPKILEDIRVLDLTHVWFGPFCTMMLAELGAEVIKVEPPWGTIGRLGPGALHKGVSSTFYALNLNKKDVSIDLKSLEGQNIFKELVKKSDVVIQNFAPGTMERLGFDYDTLKKLNPPIIYAALSGFGQTGPYSSLGSYAAIAEAMSGHTYATGKRHDSDGPPNQHGRGPGRPRTRHVRRVQHRGRHPPQGQDRHRADDRRQPDREHGGLPRYGDHSLQPIRKIEH